MSQGDGEEKVKTNNKEQQHDSNDHPGSQALVRGLVAADCTYKTTRKCKAHAEPGGGDITPVREGLLGLSEVWNRSYYSGNRSYK